MAASHWRKLRLSEKQKFRISNGENRVVSSRYTWLTFLPKVLVEHFRRLSNFFFLSLIIIQLTLSVPTNPIPYIITFALVMVVGAIRQGYEDWVRHRADQKVNHRKVIHFDPESGNLMPSIAENLAVGQIVRMCEDEDVPADMLLLASVSHDNNVLSKCQITTANLDGETTKKFRFCPLVHSLEGEFKESKLLSQIMSEGLEIEYEESTVNLYKLDGMMTSEKQNGKQVAITAENMLWRGATIKNCKYTYGWIMYTGKDTRLSMNSVKAKKNKFSVVDKATNWLVLGAGGVIFLLTGIAVGLFFQKREALSASQAWYLPEETDSTLWLGVITFFLFLVFLSYMIPISLYISVEFQKVLSSKMFGWDEDMRCPDTGSLAVWNTSDLNDELGQIEYLLADKTGTLTDNLLEFKCCSIAGRMYEYAVDANENQRLVETLCANDNGQKETVDEKRERQKFLEALALCHTVRAIGDDKESLHYQGSSIDEEVLVTATNRLGVLYAGSDNDGNITVEYEYERQRKLFRRHAVLEFDSNRKCMSVVVEDDESKFHLFTKGAESVLLPKCQAKSDSEILHETSKHIDQFASKGYRTLIVAKKELSAEEFKLVMSKTEELRKEPEKLQKFYGEIEHELTLLGATGVVDQLQVNVHQTLTALKAAGIRIWMLTGDKMETAVSTAFACGLVPPLSQGDAAKAIGYITNVTTLQALLENLDKIKTLTNNARETTLVIDGISFATGFEHCREGLAKCCLNSSQVILCRMSPLQKAQVVKLIRETSKKRICAVGDGGNDVAMIQEAHVGIGIFGREGRQASQAADFAIPKFQHLSKAILVHGNWYYYRLTNLVLYFFYRGTVFVLPPFFYGFDSAFSGEPIYDAIFMMCFSLVFTSLPIIIYGHFEQRHSAEELLANPSLYAELRGNALMRGRNLFEWIGSVVYHSLLIYYLPRLIWGRGLEEMDWATYSMLFNNLVVAVTLIKLASWIVFCVWVFAVIEILSFAAFIVFYSILLEALGAGLLQYSYFRLLSNPDFWYVTILVCVMSIIPDLISNGFRRRSYLQGILKGKLRKEF